LLGRSAFDKVAKILGLASTLDDAVARVIRRPFPSSTGFIVYGDRQAERPCGRMFHGRRPCARMQPSGGWASHAPRWS
jgi:hypothetical protein